MNNVIFAEGFLESHPLLGWAVSFLIIVVLVLSHLSNTIDSLQSIKSKLLIPLANKLKHKKLVKAAIKSDVESGINTVIDDINQEMPKGWVKPLKISWVRKESRETFINEGNIVIKVEPLDKEDRNFVNALYFYSKNCFFPTTKSVIEETQYEATVMQFCRRIVHQSKPSYESAFNDDILEPAILKRKKIPEYMERLEVIDQRGFFTGVFIREVHNIAKLVRFSSKRSSMGSEFSEVLKHLEEFLGELVSPEVNSISDGKWDRQGSIASYGLILVAHPSKAASGAIKGYINRVKERSNKNIEHLYVFGATSESEFVKEVVEEIKKDAFGYKLIEEFSLNKDYRGEKGGRGALFILDKT
jgi:hypothetical protein